VVQGGVKDQRPPLSEQVHGQRHVANDLGGAEPGEGGLTRQEPSRGQQRLVLVLDPALSGVEQGGLGSGQQVRLGGLPRDAGLNGRPHGRLGGGTRQMGRRLPRVISGAAAGYPRREGSRFHGVHGSPSPTRGPPATVWRTASASPKPKRFASPSNSRTRAQAGQRHRPATLSG